MIACGKYFHELCSDDGLMPKHAENCVGALKSNSGVIVYRAILYEQDERREESIRQTENFATRTASYDLPSGGIIFEGTP